MTHTSLSESTSTTLILLALLYQSQKQTWTHCAAQKLELNCTLISDEGLLRLLGIDMKPVDRTDRRTLALKHLDVNCNGPTHKSGARILLECGRLEVPRIPHSRIACLELFQGNTTWQSAPILKELRLDIKPLVVDSDLYYSSHGALIAALPAYTAMEQRQIWNCLQSMVNLRHLEIAGYPLDLAVVENMSFAKQLESAYVHLTIRVPHEQIASKKGGILAQADEWISRNPQGWSCYLNEGTFWSILKLEMAFCKQK
ncbi:hypothetical protein BG000_010062 [Podila horticola]|nr:hypothetical protein BG000_010062 [Podila horticola]